MRGERNGETGTKRKGEWEQRGGGINVDFKLWKGESISNHGVEHGTYEERIEIEEEEEA